METVTLFGGIYFSAPFLLLRLFFFCSSPFCHLQSARGFLLVRSPPPPLPLPLWVRQGRIIVIPGGLCTRIYEQFSSLASCT